ncbi:DUF4124 domain-containing protein [Ottowia sp.]|uniref:DUF4124 domain-containing protein n=1 Tax=Ottowia sp. TaxID=1898956 RepID=UPI003A85C278
MTQRYKPQPSTAFGPRPFVLATVLAASLLATAAPASAQIKRWVDENGVVHFSNADPQPADQVASPVTEVPLARQPSAAESAAAQQQLEKYRQQLAQNPPAAPASAASSPQPQTPSADDQSCAAQWQRYNAAYACLDPYRAKGGAIKAEGFAKCPVVKQPSCPAP